MGNIVCNIAKGRVVELYNRVVSNDPANSALVLVALEDAGLETDAVLQDYDTLADLLAGASAEQTDMGRKILTDADLAALSAPDDSNDYRECALPSVIWAAATGNDVGKIVVGLIPDTTSYTDADIVPLTIFDFPVSPTGVNVEMTGGVFYRGA